MHTPLESNDIPRPSLPKSRKDNNSSLHTVLSNSLTTEDIVMKNSSVTSETKRNWKGLVLALLVIFFISALILLACFLTYESKQPINYGIPLSLDDALMVSTQMHRPNAQFAHGMVVYLSENGTLVSTNLKTYKCTTLLTTNQLHEKSNFTGTFTISDDMSSLLLRYNFIPVYRRSFLSYYQAVLLSNETNSGNMARINIGPSSFTSDQPLLYHALFSPTALSVAFVYQKQLYYMKNPFEMNPDDLVHVTEDMPTEGVLYGIAGFLYEEEIIGTSRTFWWSPDDQKLAFTEIDERNVTETKLFFFEAENNLEGEIVNHRYPKAGETNPYNIPALKIHIHSLDTKENIEFPRPIEIPWNASLCFFKWINDDQFLTGWADRKWKESWLVLGDWKTKSMTSIYREITQFGWTDMPNQQSNAPLIESGGKSFLIIIPNYYSPEVYRGIARIYLNQSKVGGQQFTHWVHTPNYDVKDILYSYGENEVVYMSSGPDSTEMHIFWTEDAFSGHCLTCDNPDCLYNAAKFSEDGQHVIQECLGPGPPSTFLRRVKISSRRTNGSRIAHLETMTIISNNTLLRESVANRALPTTKFPKIVLRNGTKNELVLQTKIMHPPELRESQIVQYPLLLITYGGPISQTATKKYAMDWFTYMSSTLKFVVVSIDGRGTGSRGKRFEGELYNNLGVVEIKDQMDGLRQILNDYKFINRSMLCSFGWSYGGFTVANMIGHPENDFLNCGVSVAPVTDFRLYDSAYTEKYLGMYTENSHEYMRTRVSRLAENFKSKDFLLVHGMADDNVNLINSALLMKELIRNGVQFQMMFYPDENHFIAQKNSRPHLWRTVINFIVDSVNRTSFRHHNNFDSV